MLAYTSRPPDPALVGERWRQMWLERLDNTVLLVEAWLRHQRRDRQWRHGSVCEDFRAIRCPVYAVGGWADGYSNAIPRLLAGLEAPSKGLIGPWAHKYPHFATPGPQIGFLQECLRWWDQWLKGIDTGIMDEPVYRVWMQDSVPPMAQSRRASRPLGGRAFLALVRHRGAGLRSDPRPLTARAGRAGGGRDRGAHAGISRHGRGSWCGFGLNADAPWDQRADDGMAVCFETAPLPERLEILGAPALNLELSCDRPNGLLCARLCDVAPDGASLRVTYGLLNLTHHASHEHPAPLEPGRRYAVRLQLNDAAHAFPAGHRIRLALSTSYWPIAWPSPEPATVTLATGGARLSLPIRRARPEDAALSPFPEAESAPPESRTTLREGGFERSFAYDVATDTMTYTSISDSGRQRIDAIGLELEEIARKVYRINERRSALGRQRDPLDDEARPWPMAGPRRDAAPACARPASIF